MFLNLIGNIFASREANFVSATMFARVGKQGNICGNIAYHKCFRNDVSQGFTSHRAQRVIPSSPAGQRSLVIPFHHDRPSSHKEEGLENLISAQI